MYSPYEDVDTRSLREVAVKTACHEFGVDQKDFYDRPMFKRYVEARWAALWALSCEGLSHHIAVRITKHCKKEAWHLVDYACRKVTEWMMNGDERGAKALRVLRAVSGEDSQSVRHLSHLAFDCGIAPY